MPPSNDDSRNGPRSLWIFLAGLALLILLQLPRVLDPAAEMAPPRVEKVYISATPPASVTQIVTLTEEAAVGTSVPKQTRMAIYATTAAVSHPRTRTPVHSLTPTWTVLPSSTLQPGERATLDYLRAKTFATGVQYATRIAEFPATCDGASGLISPTGKWLARTCNYNPEETLQILDRSGVVWEFEFKDFVLPNESGGLGGLYPLYWTGDDGYLYFASYVGVDGGGMCFYGFGASGLFRLNIADGTWTTVLGIRGVWDGYQISFSPFGRRFVYALDSPILVDLITGVETHLEAEGGESGSFIWSPDGSELAYAYCRASEDYEKFEESGIKIYSLQSGTTRTIVSGPGKFFDINWRSQGDRLRISEWDSEKGANLNYYYEWSSGEVIAFTP